MGCGSSKSEFVKVVNAPSTSTSTTEKPERHVHFPDPEFVLHKIPDTRQNGVNHNNNDNRPVFKRVQSPKIPGNSRAANFKMAPALVPTSPKLTVPRKRPKVTLPDVELPPPRPPATKREDIIPDVTAFNKVDDHALTAPRSMEGSVEILARYLVLPARSDLEKVRGFYRWITNNIAYDTDSHFLGKRKPVDAESVLRLKRAVSSGYSNLFAGLCRVARIPAKCIHGFAKGFDYNPFENFHELDSTNHSWNAVYVQDDWRLVECSWGAGHLDSNKKFMYAYKEFYFMPNPEDVIFAHFPCVGTDLEESKPWQLLEEPVDLGKFNKVLKPVYRAIEWGVQFVSHKICVLDVWKKVNVTIESGDSVSLGVVSAQLIQNEKEIRHHVMVLKLSDGKFQVTVRPPTKGKYILKILGNIDPDATETLGLVEYYLRCHEAIPDCQPYPDHFGPWGPVTAVKSFGFVSPESINPSIVTDNGRVAFSLETNRCMEAVTRLSYGLGNIADIDDYAMLESTANEIHITAHFPRDGFYKLKIMSKSDKDEYKQAINYIIECRKTIQQCSPLPKVYKFAREYQCRLLEPLDLHVTGRTQINVRFTSDKIKDASILGRKFEKVNNNEWEAIVTTCFPGEKFIIYGSISGSAGSFKSLYEFKIV
ncbi:kyphoscoliosis peptidase-like [Pecten maximus]|uniref:kyphoscoliosis peptidase-like n=1 Tax=Pecten maximus TaxID=6579 RepID=UPI00145908AD|nr:kyphoscoliosis peptidase-like [Pecten maximus]